MLRTIAASALSLFTLFSPYPAQAYPNSAEQYSLTVKDIPWTVLQDHREPLRWYYLPAAASLSETGKRQPVLAILKYQVPDPANKQMLFFIAAGVLLVVVAITRQLMYSRYGELLVAVRDQEERVRFLGYDPANVKIVACGTSYHAGLVGKYIIEELAKIPTTVQISSEYRYSSVSRESPLMVLVTQSGETLDTMAAAREARKRGNKTVAIANVMGSAITREVDHVIYTRTGPEIGIAATKTFVTQLVALYLLAMDLGAQNKTLSVLARRAIIGQLRSLPRAVQDVLNKAPEIEALAKKYHGARDMFFIGRNVNYPIALEGALKTKEISYIHGEGYPAGELKHGPLALISKDSPVVAIAIKDHTYDKMLGNISEVSARGSPVIAIGFEGDRPMHLPPHRPIES